MIFVRPAQPTYHGRLVLTESGGLSLRGEGRLRGDTVEKLDWDRSDAVSGDA
jgi:hypothetical protein